MPSFVSFAIGLATLEAAAKTATASLWAIFAWFSDTYSYNAAVDFLVVQSGNCCLCFSIIFHLYKAEALRATSVAVHDNLSACYNAVRFKCCAQSFVSSIKR